MESICRCLRCVNVNLWVREGNLAILVSKELVVIDDTVCGSDCSVEAFGKPSGILRLMDEVISSRNWLVN